ncbi:MAG TPA: nitroreductase family protein [Amoebophilaceae bacterium]|jgi:SagB-type dehydrogenase family enzyme|nr:nitroreductase family protein [Amoebophilaceae bacterium]
MSLKFFTFNHPSEASPIALVDPLLNRRENLDIDSCIERIEGFEEPPCHIPDMLAIEHWWNRKWQTALDYYLLSHASLEHRRYKAHTRLPLEVGIFLPSAFTEMQFTCMEALKMRKTHRKFHDYPLALDLFASILHHLTPKHVDVWKYYIVVFNVSGISEGVYQYCPIQHGLVPIRQGNFKEIFASLLCGIIDPMTASFSIVLSVDLEIAQRMLPYERGLREIYIDAGRIAQKVVLSGVRYHLGVFQSAAMLDRSMCDFLQVSPECCIPLYTMVIGAIAEDELQFTMDSPS